MCCCCSHEAEIHEWSSRTLLSCLARRSEQGGEEAEKLQVGGEHRQRNYEELVTSSLEALAMFLKSPFSPSSFLFLVEMPFVPSSVLLLLVVRPGAPSSVRSLLVAMPFVLASDFPGRIFAERGSVRKLLWAGCQEEALVQMDLS